MSSSTIINTIWPDALALSHAAAHFIVTESNKAIMERGVFTIALSGGSTPKLLFELLAQEPYKNNIPWKKIVIAFGDERFVPATSDESNYKMAYEALLKHVPVEKENVLRIPTENITPAHAAKLYSDSLKKKIKRFDLVLLGIGEEGHTASIFPKSELLHDKKHLANAVWVKEKNMHRISFTLPYINKAKQVLFLVAGESKAAIVKKIFSKKGATLPAAQVKAKETTFWFLDKAAAGV